MSLELSPKPPRGARPEPEWERRIRLLLAERRRYTLPEARSLAGLRRSISVSQETLGHRMNISQARLSRFERHPDPRLGAIEHYVTALGGTLILIARLPDRDVHLTRG